QPRALVPAIRRYWIWACRRTSSGEIVGHTDIQVTMTIYAHASLDKKRRALTQLDDRLA
ncbi:MAG: hypothetical protein QOG60_501, partial [Frankiaceae bacterium]|nr:hypothetical protein [Frankiaceae bacterium]